LLFCYKRGKQFIIALLIRLFRKKKWKKIGIESRLKWKCKLIQFFFVQTKLCSRLFLTHRLKFHHFRVNTITYQQVSIISRKIERARDRTADNES
jgi:hypothetical protein